MTHDAEYESKRAYALIGAKITAVVTDKEKGKFGFRMTDRYGKEIEVWVYSSRESTYCGSLAIHKITRLNNEPQK